MHACATANTRQDLQPCPHSTRTHADARSGVVERGVVLVPVAAARRPLLELLGVPVRVVAAADRLAAPAALPEHAGPAAGAGGAGRARVPRASVQDVGEEGADAAQEGEAEEEVGPPRPPLVRPREGDEVVPAVGAGRRGHHLQREDWQEFWVG